MRLIISKKFLKRRSLSVSCECELPEYYFLKSTCTHRTDDAVA